MAETHAVELYYLGSAPTVVSDLEAAVVQELLADGDEGTARYRRYRQATRSGEHELFVRTTDVRQIRITPPRPTPASESA